MVIKYKSPSDKYLVGLNEFRNYYCLLIFADTQLLSSNALRQWDKEEKKRKKEAFWGLWVSSQTHDP